MEDTCWLILGNMCQWLGKHRVDIQEYFDQKKPRCMSEIQWWIYVAAVETIIKAVNILFVSGQGLMTLVKEQQKSLDNLKQSLLEIVGGRRIIIEEPNDDNLMQSGFVVAKVDAIAMIKDCGLFYRDAFDEIGVSIQNDV